MIVLPVIRFAPQLFDLVDVLRMDRRGDGSASPICLIFLRQYSQGFRVSYGVLFSPMRASFVELWAFRLS